jgi:flagellar protein FlaI
MQEEPLFFINDFLENRGQFNKIIEEIKKKPEDYSYKAQFLKNFVNNLCMAYINLKKNRICDKEKLKIELENKKKELLAKLEEIKKGDIKAQINLQLPKKSLILSKLSKKPIVFRTLDKEYNIIEPSISPNDKLVIDSIIKEVKDYDEDLIKSKIKEKFGNIDVDRFDSLRYYIVRDFKSVGLVSPLLEDDEIQEIVCDGVNIPLIVVLKSKVNTNIVFKSDKELNEQIYKFAKLIGNSISEENPFLEGAINTNFMVEANLSTEFLSGKFVIKRL